MQLMIPDIVPDFLRNADCGGLVTDNHVSNRQNGAFANRTCKDCKKKYETKHHRHSSGQKQCPIVQEEKAIELEAYLVRKKRKGEDIEVMGGIDVILKKTALYKCIMH